MTFYNRSNSGLPDNRVIALAVDSTENKWIGTSGGGVAKFDGVNWTVYNTGNSELPNNWIHAFTIDSANNIWIGSGHLQEKDGGLAKFDGVNWTVTYFKR